MSLQANVDHWDRTALANIILDTIFEDIPDDIAIDPVMQRHDGAMIENILAAIMAYNDNKPQKGH